MMSCTTLSERPQSVLDLLYVYIYMNEFVEAELLLETDGNDVRFSNELP